MNLIIEPTSELGGIFLGNLESAKNVYKLKQNNIKAVLTVAARSDISYHKSEIKNHEIILADDVPSFNLSKYFDHIFNWIDNERRMQHNVLVHCFAGISRSATALIAYLMMKNNWTYDKSLFYCRSKRKITNPNSGFAR